MKPPVESYIVRIYRERSSGFAGVVEDTESGRVLRFSCMDELCGILRRHFEGGGCEPVDE